MFGLMKSRTCASNVQAAKLRRLHYCGTCKTMGSLYGQRARLLLNNDAVFLAELLTALSPEMPALENWSGSLQSYNCMAMPKGEEQMPLPLQIAATATLVMSEFKVVDQVTDNANSGWKMIGRIYSQSFLDATARMRSWEFPVKEMWDWNVVQQEREAEALRAPGDRTADEILAATAKPTAVVTGLTFQHGARTIGSDLATQEAMYALGHAFGSLIFVLDAYDDDAKDAKKGDFNALQAAYSSAGKPLTEEQKQSAIASLQQLAGEIAQRLRALPLSETQIALYTNRLHSNLANKLGVSITCCSTSAATCKTSTTKQRVRFARWKQARATAGGLVQQHRAECAGFLATAQAPFLFVCLFLAALVFPRQAMSATSSRECLGMFFNLMFWGAALKAVLMAPQRLLAPAYRISDRNYNAVDPGIGHSSSGGSPTETVVTTVRQRRRISCCCDCCDWECDCCCDGCDCACCACEGLECCSSCGDCASCCDCCSSCS